MPLLFEDAAKAKDAIMVSQQKEIQKLYDDWAKDIADRAKFYSHKTNASAAVSERYYKELYAQMKETSNQVGKEIQGLITSNMYTIADAVVKSNVDWLKEFGFSESGLNAAFSYIPNDVVQRLVTGQIYQSGWSLSQRIWSDSQQTQRDIYQVMARGLAEQKSIYEIAKDLESYVRPSAKLPWNPVLAMKNTQTGRIEYKRIYKKQVDYNAQRLARTLAQHSYQQSFIATTQNNPFITEYVWHSNGSRVCDLCKARDGATFKKTELPMDHPNGMCVMEPVVVKDMVDQLANWFNSPDGTYPEIDAFASNFGYEAQPVNKTLDFVNKYGMSTKSPNAWYNSLTKIQKAEAKALKDASGLNWNDWYEQNIKSTGDANLDYAKKYGTSTKSPNAWFNSLTPAQKAEAKVLKDASGLTWNQWYEKYVHAGSATTATTTAKVAAKADDAITVFKKKYSEADFAVISDKAYFGNPEAKKVVEEFLKANGIKASDFAKYQDSVGDFDPDKYKALIKSVYGSATTTTTTTGAATQVGNAIDTAAWYDSVRQNNLREMNKWTKDWLDAITPDEKNGVYVYTSNAYTDMNRYLRGQSSTTRYADEIEAAKKALAKASLPQETIVRRGSGYNMLDELGFGDVTPQNKSNFIGAIVEDKGFVSTSPSPSGGFSGSIEYVIKLPKGSQAMYVDSISYFKGEEELLINAGGRFAIEDVEFDNYGTARKIYMTLKNLQ